MSTQQAPQLKQCEVCKKDIIPKYKCPICLIKYCSIDCFKLHKTNTDQDFNCETRKAQKLSSKSQPQQTIQPEQRTNDLILDENDVIVPEERIKRALSNDKIRGYLSHSKLKVIIKEIDGARQKKKELWRRMKIDPDFRVFIDDLLKELGYLNENGQFEIKQESISNSTLQ